MRDTIPVADCRDTRADPSSTPILTGFAPAVSSVTEVSRPTVTRRAKWIAAVPTTVLPTVSYSQVCPRIR